MLLALLAGLSLCPFAGVADNELSWARPYALLYLTIPILFGDANTCPLYPPLSILFKRPSWATKGGTIGQVEGYFHSTIGLQSWTITFQPFHSTSPPAAAALSLSMLRNPSMAMLGELNQCCPAHSNKPVGQLVGLSTSHVEFLHKFRMQFWNWNLTWKGQTNCFCHFPENVNIQFGRK